MRRRWVAGAVATGVVAIAGASDASAATDALTVVGASAPVGVAHSDFDVRVAVHNAETQLLCRPFDVTLWWSQPRGSRGSRTVVDDGVAGTTSTTLVVPGARVRPGELRFWVTATQRCGWLGSVTTYAGRWPAVGARTVRIVPGPA
jgi:hypothetical protein